MRLFSFLFAVIILGLTVGCQKDNFPKFQNTIKDTLPQNYPFAGGFCEGVSLGVAIPDTNFYLPALNASLPESVILEMPIPGDQGSQNSCTSWATVYSAGTYHFRQTLSKPYSDTGNLSPKFSYNLISKGNCSCTSFLDNLYLLKTIGAVTLGTMPYNPAECIQQPDESQIQTAQLYKINGWQKLPIQNLNLVQQALYENKPVLFSINIDDGFIKIPAPYLWNSRAGNIGQPHAMVISGYDNNKKAFKIMNSWSTGWGDQGFAWIDYEFFQKNANEFGYIIY